MSERICRRLYASFQQPSIFSASEEKYLPPQRINSTTMKLLEDHLRQLCDKPASGNLEPGFSHYFQPGISVMVSVAIVVLLIFWVGARSKSGGTILQDPNIFTGFIISCSTFPHDVQRKILESFQSGCERQSIPAVQAPLILPQKLSLKKRLHR